MQLNGLLTEKDTSGVTRGLDVQVSAAAEARTAELITLIQPNQVSEDLRRAVACYVQRLIMNCFPCQVFTFGSVPLKTYLPDGDIDLTAFSNNEELKEKWADLVQDALKQEEKSESAEFHVKEVQYIHAEVKIIKCLVENIVVDISFNQVGGLCTLCFLEEIDYLIDHNHLFKRSIILIKAWCYYESRILGAHHGLISTYALETLVLYIFHIFNNKFAGPLEVLYRFLEFFSNFDWEKFCVSLWGPVAIDSLPDTTAKVPPRADDSALLLKKDKLETLSATYAVVPTAQDNLGHPFLSKHFNVVDPLRTNNNLGRSVSKGNFFRIRSAFDLGAKRLSRILDRQNENLINELNQFFRNTLVRNAVGNRLDAPSLNLRDIQPSSLSSSDVQPSDSESDTVKISSRSSALHMERGNIVQGGHYYHDPTSELLSRIGSQSQSFERLPNLLISHPQNQKVYSMPHSTKIPDNSEGNIRASVSGQNENKQKAMKWKVNSNDRNVQSKFQFVRTRSSPELTDSSADLLPYGRRGMEMDKHFKVDFNGRRQVSSREVFSNHGVTPVDDPSSYASYQSARASSETQSVSNSISDDVSFGMSEDIASMSKIIEKQSSRNQEQEMVNRLSSANLQELNPHVHVPMQMVSPYPLVPSSSFVASTVPPRSLSGVVPANLPVLGASWIPNMQLFQGFVAPHLTHYIQNPSFTPNHVDNESVHEKPLANESVQDDNVDLHDQYNGLVERRDVRLVNIPSKQQLPEASTHDGLRSSVLAGQPRNGREGPQHAMEDHDDFHDQRSRGHSLNTNMVGANLRISSASQTSSSKNRSSFDSSSDDNSGRVRRQPREKWGKRPSFGTESSHFHARPKTVWPGGSLPENDPVENDDGTQNEILLTSNSECFDRLSGSESSSAHPRILQVPDNHEDSHISLPSTMFPLGPVLLGPSQQRMADKSGAPPIFYPTGPPVPILMFPFVTGKSDASVSQVDGTDLFAEQSFPTLENVDRSVNVSSVASTSGASETTEEYGSDILHSDFASHLQNLHFGRCCQSNFQMPGPYMYHSIGLPPLHVQSQFVKDGPGMLPSPNANMAQLMSYGPRLIPLMAIQPGSERNSGSFQRPGEEVSRFRGGTGTYLPNPPTQKISPRDRQSNMRNYRGAYNTDKGDHGDKEGSWLNPRHRNTFRNHGRSYSERALRADRLAMDDNQSNRWRASGNGPFKHDPAAPPVVPAPSFESSNLTRNLGNMRFGVYTPPATTSNGINMAESPMAPVVMVYSYDQGAHYGSSAESVEFGSFRSVPLDGNEAPRRVNEVRMNGFYDPRSASYPDESLSPDQPSSPRFRR